MAFSVERVKSHWRALKGRAAASTFRFASHILFVIVLISIGSVAAGWYGMAKDTIQLQGTHPAARFSAVYNHSEPVWAAQTVSYNQQQIQNDTDSTQLPHMVITQMTSDKANSTASSQVDNITVVKTTVLTVTSVVTDTEMETLTTTVFPSTSTIATTAYGNDNSPVTSAETDSVMTGIMYCSFTGHRNVYTLCPLVHTRSPAMLTGAPPMVSSGALGLRNPFTALRIIFKRLWNLTPAPEEAMSQAKCDCQALASSLEIAVEQHKLLTILVSFVKIYHDALAKLIGLIEELMGLNLDKPNRLMDTITHMTDGFLEVVSHKTNGFMKTISDIKRSEILDEVEEPGDKA
ncbi:hypothetical protein F4861DRAFT_545088 [Xylaria intraflava]|nr:hypothetical protein F4861DRAFT_545088 [Xylaria intraflava]